MLQMSNWLQQREQLQLHVYQLKILIKIYKKMCRDFGHQGVTIRKSDAFKRVRERLRVSVL